MLKVGLLGAGRIGRFTRRCSAHEGSKLAAVSDVYAPAAEELAAKYRAQSGVQMKLSLTIPLMRY